jgi:hypothetical protein
MVVSTERGVEWMRVDDTLLRAPSHVKKRGFSKRVKRFRIQRPLYLGDVMVDGEIKNKVWVAEGREILGGDHGTVFTEFHLKLW